VSIRTSRLRANAPTEAEKTPEKSATMLVARVLRDVLASEPFDTLADLTDALKYRCARVRVKWTNDAISEAYRLVASNRPLVTRDVRVVRRNTKHSERLDDVPRVPRGDAAAILQRLGVSVPRG